VVQVIRPAIGNFGVNRGYFEPCLFSVLASEFFLSKAALVCGKLGSVFSRMAGIAGFETLRGDEQILDSYVNADFFIRDRQQRRLKFTQAGNEISSGLIFRHGDRSGRTWQFTTPANIKGILAFRQPQLTIAVFKRTLNKSGALFVFLGFKNRVFSPAFKEVFKSRLLVSQALLQGNAGNLIEKRNSGFCLISVSLALASV
jgi:hypothetical protein